MLKNRLAVTIVGLAIGGYLGFAQAQDKCPKFPILLQLCAAFTVPTAVATGAAKGGGLAFAAASGYKTLSKDAKSGVVNPKLITFGCVTIATCLTLYTSPPDIQPSTSQAKAASQKAENKGKYTLIKGQSKIVDFWGDEAIWLYKNHGVDPTIFLAIASHESARGTKPIGEYNYFGIKHHKGAPKKVITRTTECYSSCQKYDLGFADWHDKRGATLKMLEILKRLGKGDPNNVELIGKGYATDGKWSKGIRRHQQEIRQWVKLSDNKVSLGNPVPGGTFQWGFTKDHQGVDILAPIGTPVIASHSGVVVKAGWDDYGLGNVVEILGDSGELTVYGHNSELLVKKT